MKNRLFLTIFVCFFCQSLFAQMSPSYRTRIGVDLQSVLTDKHHYTPENSARLFFTLPFFQRDTGFFVGDTYLLGDLSGRAQNQAGLALSSRWRKDGSKVGYGATVFGDLVRLSDSESGAQLVFSGHALTENRSFFINFFAPRQDATGPNNSVYQLLPGFDLCMGIWQPISFKASVHTFFAYTFFEKSEQEIYQGPRFSMALESFKGGYSRFMTLSSFYDNYHGPSVRLGLSMVFNLRGETNPLLAVSEGMDRPVYRTQTAFIYENTAS